MYGFRGMETESISEVLYFGTRGGLFTTNDFRTHGTCITEAVLCTSEGMKENWTRV